MPKFDRISALSFAEKFELYSFNISIELQYDNCDSILVSFCYLFDQFLDFSIYIASSS